MRTTLLTAAILAAISFQPVFAAVQTVAVLPSEGVLKDNELEFLTDKALEMAVMEKKIPDGFMKISGAAPQEKTAPPSVDEGVGNNVFTDKRDGKKYKAVKIGTQTWMAENLNYNASGSKCYGNKPENCTKYGRLYDWDAAMEACPYGWHLPSKSEYEVLDKAVGGEKVAGKRLKAKNGWNSYQGKSGNGTDEFGFSALPGGGGSSDGGFNFVGDIGLWWSSSENYVSYAYLRGILYYDYAYWNYSGKGLLLSVRCVKD